MESSTVEQLGARQFCSECGRPCAPEDLVHFGPAAVCAECKPSYVQRMREGATTSSAPRYGGFWRRFVALFIDSVLIGVVSYPIQMMTIAPSGVNAMRSDVALKRLLVYWSLGMAISWALEFIYSVYFVSQKSATLGKMIMGLKIVTANGGPISVGRAIGRYFARYLSSLILLIGYIMAAFDDQKRALHDHICNTRVIRD